MRPRSAMQGDSLVLHVALRDIKPAIWRRLRVPADLTLNQLHNVLQVALGWSNSHLHDFVVGDVHFGMADVEDELFSVDEVAAPLGAVAHVKSKFLYRYDFGDGWEHDVTVESVAPDEDEALVCLGGARACPPEDSGGIGGYRRLVEILADKTHREYRDLKQWVGPRYDPEKFDLTAINKRLATLAKRLGRGRPLRNALN